MGRVESRGGSAAPAPSRASARPAVTGLGSPSGELAEAQQRAPGLKDGDAEHGPACGLSRQPGAAPRVQNPLSDPSQAPERNETRRA